MLAGTIPGSLGVAVPLASPGAAPRPRLVVIWRVTEACNVDCLYCDYRRGLRRPRRSVGANDVLAFGRVLADYAAASEREVLISWLGGEPLVWPPLWEVSAVLHRAYGLPLSLTTNGTRLGEPGVVGRLMEDYAEVTLSVDGPAATHDQVRNAPGLHARLRQAAGALQEHKARLGRGPLVRANLVLMRSNLRCLEAVGLELAAWGVEALTFNGLGGRPGDPGFERERLRPDDLAWLAAELPRLRAVLAERGLRLCGAGRYLDRLAHSARGLPIPVDDCAPGQSLLFVDEQGRIGPCAFTTSDYGIPIAELRDAGDLQALPARLADQRRRRLAAACQDCQSTHVFGKFEAAAA